jgi:L-asparaginase II
MTAHRGGRQNERFCHGQILRISQTGEVEFTERELRELLFSPYGMNCGTSLLAIPEGGSGITVKLADGTTRTANDRASALALLKEVFNWTPDKVA